MVALWRYLETGMVPNSAVLLQVSDRRAMPPADVIQDRRVTVLVQGLAPAPPEWSRLSWATP